MQYFIQPKNIFDHVSSRHSWASYRTFSDESSPFTVTLDSHHQLFIAPTLVSHRSQELSMQAWRDGSDILMVETALVEDPCSVLSTHAECLITLVTSALPASRDMCTHMHVDKQRHIHTHNLELRSLM